MWGGFPFWLSLLTLGFMMNTRLRAGVVLIAGVSAGFLTAQAAEPRRIQISPTETVWMKEGEMSLLSDKNHQAGRCAGFFDVTETESSWAKLDAQKESFETSFLFGGLGLERKESIARLVEEADARNFLQHIDTLSTFHTRHAKSATGIQAAEWIANKFREIGVNRTDIQVDLIRHSAFGQPSVRARIVGNGPNAAEVVVIGGHEDSTRQWDSGGRARAPGADDDASGIATVLEVFRVVVQSGVRSDRTLEFMAYAGEELGLVGSQDIALDYKNRHVAVVAVLQFDMTMVPGASNIMHFVTDNTNPQLNELLRRLTDMYVGVRWSNTQCGYGCSDHASWTRAGYPSAIPFESHFNELNNRIHTERDLLNTVKPDFGIAFAKLGVAFAAEVAGDLQSRGH